MKKILSYSICLLFILVSACRKSDNPNVPELQRVPVPVFVKDPTANSSIPGQDPTTFKGKFTVDMFFKTDVLPKKVDVVVIKNSVKTKVRTIKADITTFPTTVDITGAQLISLFGEPIVLGDNFTIGANITTQEGKLYEAFPAVGSAYGAGVAGQFGGVAVAINYAALCSFNQSLYNGTYKITRDDWQDFSIGDPIEVKPGVGPNQILVTAYPSPDYGSNRKAMILNVNPATGEVTIPTQVIGDYDGAPPGATARGTGSVELCNGSRITMTITFNIGGSDYLGYTLVISK